MSVKMKLRPLVLHASRAQYLKPVNACALILLSNAGHLSGRVIASLRPTAGLNQINQISGTQLDNEKVQSQDRVGSTPGK